MPHHVPGHVRALDEIEEGARQTASDNKHLMGSTAIIMNGAEVELRAWMRMVCITPFLVGIGCWYLVRVDKLIRCAALCAGVRQTLEPFRHARGKVVACRRNLPEDSRHVGLVESGLDS